METGKEHTVVVIEFKHFENQDSSLSFLPLFPNIYVFHFVVEILGKISISVVKGLGLINNILSLLEKDYSGRGDILNQMILCNKVMYAALCEHSNIKNCGSEDWSKDLKPSSHKL